MNDRKGRSDPGRQRLRGTGIDSKRLRNPVEWHKLVIGAVFVADDQRALVGSDGGAGREKPARFANRTARRGDGQRPGIGVIPGMVIEVELSGRSI